MSPKEIARAGLEKLVELGFTLQARLRWCRDAREIRQCVELQKSQYANLYYVNVGVVLRDLEDLPCGPFHKTHTYGRWSEPDVERALCFEPERSILSDGDRVSLLMNATERELVPLLTQLSTLDGVRAMGDGPLSSVMVRPEVRDWLLDS